MYFWKYAIFLSLQLQCTLYLFNKHNPTSIFNDKCSLERPCTGKTDRLKYVKRGLVSHALDCIVHCKKNPDALQQERIQKM